MALVSRETARLKKNYHQTFEVRKKGKLVVRHTLLLNPQTLTQNEQGRSSVTQTLGGSYVIDFGSGLPQVTIAGTTGYRRRFNADSELRDGWEEFKHFRNEVYRKFIEENDPDYEMYWYNWEDEEYHRIQPSVFRLQRSATEPLLYRYELNFTCLGKATIGKKPKDWLTGASPNFASMALKLNVSVSTISTLMYIMTGERG